jgi:hypothetical protein
MKKLYFSLIMLSMSSLMFSQNILYDNGPMITIQSLGPNDPNWSVIQPPDTAHGSCDTKGIYRLADDFSVNDASWAIDSIVFFEFQINSPAASSSFTTFNLQIWNGSPCVGSSTVVWGDTSTNILSSSYWSGIYRVYESCGLITRPIMRNVCRTPGLNLPAGGDYWVDWQADGTLPAGVWQPFITINDEAETGNGLQYDADSWKNVVEPGGAKGFPFIIYGTAVTSGANEIASEHSFDIYPNPVSDELTIEMEGNPGHMSFEILNSLGQTVFQGNLSEKTVVRVSEFSPGVYILKLKDGKTCAIKRIIKE